MTITYADKLKSPASVDYLRRVREKEEKVRQTIKLKAEKAERLKTESANQDRYSCKQRLRQIARSIEMAEYVCTLPGLTADVKEKYKRHLYYERRKLKRAQLRLLVGNLRSRVYSALNGSKPEKPIQLLGCTLAFFRDYIEKQFKPGMTWENHGEVWHIGHIRPCASFELTDSNEQRRCFNYTNTQPLFILENLKKGKRC